RGGRGAGVGALFPPRGRPLPVASGLEVKVEARVVDALVEDVAQDAQEGLADEVDVAESQVRLVELAVAQAVLDDGAAWGPGSGTSPPGPPPSPDRFAPAPGCRST